MVIAAEVFAFFAIASDDFAIGFPVIDALYGKVPFSLALPEFAKPCSTLRPK